MSVSPAVGQADATRGSSAAEVATYTEGSVGFVSVTPARVLDTRTGNGAPTGVVRAGSTTALRVTGRGGVPASGVAAVTLNVTVTSPSGAGYVTAWPNGGTRPTASNVNYAVGQTIANQVVIKVGSNGVVNLFASTSAHLIADVAGYYPVGAPYNPVVPARLIDTRTTSKPASGSTTNITVTGRGGVPTSNVAAVVLTVTAVAPTGAGYLTQYPTGAQRPTASNVNYAAGRTVAGLVFAKVGSGGRVSLYTSTSTHLLVDVAGWIPTASDYVPLTPSRLVDTRYGTGATKARIPAGGTVTLQVTGVGGVAVDGVAAVELNVTAVNPSTSGYLTTYPAGVSRPLASTVNFGAGATAANSTTLKVGTGGKVTVYSSAPTDLVVDVAGYFTIPKSITLTHDSNTVIVPDSVTESVTAPTGLGGTGTITSSGTTPAVTGQYVYLPPGGSNGDGLIGKVTAVNGTTTTVQSVPMQEAFPSGHIEGVTTSNSTLLNSADAGPGARTQGADTAAAGIDLDCTNGLTTGVSVSATADMRVAVLADWGPGKRAHLRATTTTSLTYQGSVDVKIGSTCTWSSQPVKLGMIGPFTVDAGWKIELGISAGISTAVHHETTTTDGFDWWDGQSPTRVHANSKTTGYTPPKAATGTVTFGSGPVVSLKLVGLAGPQISALAYIDVTANTNANPWWTVKFGVKAEASLSLRIAFLVHAEYTLAEALVYSVELARAPGAYTGSTPAITSTAIPGGQVGRPYTATVTGSGGTTPYRWTATGLPTGLALNSTTGAFTGTPTTSTLANPTLTLTDATGLTARKTFTLAISGPSGTSHVVQISAGSGHSCAVLSTGAVKCWGYNFHGELGNGTTAHSTTPVQVTGLTSGVATISNGQDHACAVLTTGAAKCWGYNGDGRLGNGTTTDSATPVQVADLTSGVVTISAGAMHSCATLITGAAKCWGYNWGGALGNGTTTDSTTPVQVTGLTSGVTTTSAGENHSCALLTSGGVKCWGHNWGGALGNGTTTDATTPVQVVGLTSGVAAISVGGLHSCAILTTGAAKCWGNNSAGVLGNGTTADARTPSQVVGLTSGVATINTGARHSCATLTSGAAKCWGSNWGGALGNGTTITHSTTPVQVVDLSSGVTTISAGGAHGCAMLINTVVNCWGYNMHGALGNGTTTDSTTPVQVVGLD